MIPIHKLLSRIRWDARFSIGRFTLGYLDRIERRMVTVPFAHIRFPTDAPAMFELWDDNGHSHRIPLHRVRRVYRDGRLIWARKPASE